jgi:hypothetical protein
MEYLNILLVFIVFMVLGGIILYIKTKYFKTIWDVGLEFVRNNDDKDTILFRNKLNGYVQIEIEVERFKNRLCESQPLVISCIDLDKFALTLREYSCDKYEDIKEFPRSDIQLRKTRFDGVHIEIGAWAWFIFFGGMGFRVNKDEAIEISDAIDKVLKLSE